MKYKQHVLVEYNNVCPYVETFVSNKKITLDKVLEYFIKREGDFNEEKDAITFVDVYEPIVLK